MNLNNPNNFDKVILELDFEKKTFEISILDADKTFYFGNIDFDENILTFYFEEEEIIIKMFYKMINETKYHFNGYKKFCSNLTLKLSKEIYYFYQDDLDLDENIKEITEEPFKKTSSYSTFYSKIVPVEDISVDLMKEEIINIMDLPYKYIFEKIKSYYPKIPFYNEENLMKLYKNEKYLKFIYNEFKTVVNQDFNPIPIFQNENNLILVISRYHHILWINENKAKAFLNLKKIYEFNWEKNPELLGKFFIPQNIYYPQYSIENGKNFITKLRQYF